MKAAKTFFGILTITAALAVHVQAQSFLTNGLVAYFPFNGNANDASGNGNNGVTTAITYGTNHLGVAGAAANFNGTSSLVDVTNLFSSQPTNITYSLWFSPANNLTQSNAPFTLACAAAIGGTKNGFDYVVGQNDFLTGPFNGPIYGGYPGYLGYNGPIFGLYKYENYANYYFCDTTNYLFPSNKWHQVVGVYNGSSMTLYLDGNFQTTLEYANINIGGLQNLNIGNQFSGLIDDVRVYFGALTSNQVSQLYAIESAPIVNIQKAVYLTSNNLWTGSNYQVQASSDLINWTNQGSAFTATTNYWRSTNYWDVPNWNQLFFRLKVSP